MDMQRPVSSVSPLQGLHFMVHNSVPDNLEGYTPSKCNLYTLHRFSRDVFVDPYELEQRFQDKVLPKSQVWGETDLELPVSAVEEGSLVLIGPLGSTLDFDLPIHARYPLPSTTESHATVMIQTPHVLTVCNARREYYIYIFFSQKGQNNVCEQMRRKEDNLMNTSFCPIRHPSTWSSSKWRHGHFM
jgi:hypothetical protein